MFAPRPEHNSRWPVIEGQLVHGTTVDVYNGREGIVDFSKPELVSAVYQSSRWRKFLSNMEDHGCENRPQFLALNYSRYRCRLWNTDT